MIRFRQHIPNFVETDTPPFRVTVATIAELLAQPQIARWAESEPGGERRGTVTGWPNGVERRVEVIYDVAPNIFRRFSLADGRMLMVEYNGGDHFWVVGYVDADDPHELEALPPWVENETARLRREAWNRGDMGPQKSPYRCAEHGVDHADCCLKRTS